MKLRYLLYPILLLFLTSGCAHLSSSSAKSDESNPEKETILSPSGEYSSEMIHQNQPMLALGGTQTEITAEADERQMDSVVGNEKSDNTSTNNHDNDLAGATPAIQKIQTDLDDALDLCQLSQDFWQQGELENAVDALDRAYALILSVDTSDQPKLIQQKEDLRFMISKRILEIYASRNIVINGNYNAIPITINRHVQAEIDLFTKGRERRFFIDSYKRSGRYRNRIVRSLREAGLPLELSWLPLIESGFKVNALSRSRALGMWQFIPSTGYKFGLSRDKFVDQRMDPEKSTQAAIAYLKELHKLFGDWATVLAAYNCGEGRVLRLIRGQNINYLDNFWDLYQRLPRETARYVPRFLATLHILGNLETYGIDQIAPDPPLDFEGVTINKQVHLSNVAKSIGVDRKILQDLNPELRYQIVPGENYRLNVPPGKGDLLLAKIDTIPVSHPPQRAFVYHRVRRGESLSIIARKYRTSVRKIMRANNMRRSNYIVAGKRIKVPQRGYMTKSSQIIRKPKNGQALTHRVRKGDSLYIIAKQYGTTTKKIQTLNNLKTTILHIGQILTIFPGKNIKPPAVDGLATYEVRAGDSPFQIAKRHNMELVRFLHLNQLDRRSKIFPGQKVYIE
ncbi:MAG: LysM peptidoglycan-binding domain-containing protein [Desulfobacterales bacterium]|jgi:membrane-bound lytic murein transglycosylase D